MMNKKILVSAVTATVLGSLFVGCGGGSSSTTPTTSSTGTGSFTTSTGATGYAMKGALNGAAFTENGTEISFSGGTEEDTGLAPTLNVETDTELLDADGKIIANAFTTIAMQFPGDDPTRAIGKLANAMGINASGLVAKMHSDSPAAAELENLGRVYGQLLNAAVNQGSGAMTALTNAIEDSSGTAGVEGLLGELNSALPTAIYTAAQITQIVLNLPKNPTEFAKESAKFDAEIAKGTNLEFTISPVTNPRLTGISLDTNMTIGATTGDFDTATISMMSLDANDSDITPETSEILIEIANTDADGINANASYAVKLSKLCAVVDGTNITGFTNNANTTMSITANSNLSVAETLDFAKGDGDITALFTNANIDLNNSRSIGFGAFADYITSLVNDAELDSATDGNFTSGMESNTSDYSVKMMLNVDDRSFVTSDREYTIRKTDTVIDGVVTSGYQVIDSNIAN